MIPPPAGRHPLRRLLLAASATLPLILLPPDAGSLRAGEPRDRSGRASLASGSGVRARRSAVRELSTWRTRWPRRPAEFALFVLGDSLSHGTMDATNNALNTLHGYVQFTAGALAEEEPSLLFSQPLFNEWGRRQRPFRLPTNLAVDGSDLFTAEGLAYYKRAGTAQTLPSSNVVCDAVLPLGLKSKYDKVLYPINLRSGRSVSQVDALVWSLNHLAAAPGETKAIVILWIGNNDSGSAALGGGARPAQIPLPADLVEQEITWGLRKLLEFGQQAGEVAFEPYTMASIQRNLTEAADFDAQYRHIIERIETEVILPPERMEIFLLTLPYYTSVGFLLDSDDLEYYFRKLDPDYVLPPTFQRISPPGEPITDPMNGDWISIMTFGLMYALLEDGYTTGYINQALEMEGVQRDGLVATRAEREYVSARIDQYNETIRDVAAGRPNVHVVEAAALLNEGLAGQLPVTVGGRSFGRKWVRGNSFSLDGVHPGYTVHALIANHLLERIGQVTGIEVPLRDPEAVMAVDPYIDRDGDGWAPGPDYRTTGEGTLLFLFRDADDANPDVGPQFPRDLWRVVSRGFIQRMISQPAMKAEAQRLGIVPQG